MSRGTVLPRCQIRGQVITIASRQAPIAASPTSRRVISRRNMSRASSQFAMNAAERRNMVGGVVIALIAIGVIAFLAFDAWILFRVFAGRASRDDYGTFMVPGETTVTAPAGKLKISYQEEYKASSTGDSIDFGVPGELQVTITNDAGGEPMEIKGPGFRGTGESLDTGSGWSRALVGTLQITEPGSYTVKAGPSVEGGVESKILIGK